MKDLLAVAGIIFLVFLAVLVLALARLGFDSVSKSAPVPPVRNAVIERVSIGRLVTDLTDDAVSTLYRFDPEPGVRCYFLVPSRDQFASVARP
jgi:hypothetical protein